jgi:hypothetical protein
LGFVLNLVLLVDEWPTIGSIGLGCVLSAGDCRLTGVDSFGFDGCFCLTAGTGVVPDFRYNTIAIMTKTMTAITTTTADIATINSDLLSSLEPSLEPLIRSQIVTDSQPTAMSLTECLVVHPTDPMAGKQIEVPVVGEAGGRAVQVV